MVQILGLSKAVAAEPKPFGLIGGSPGQTRRLLISRRSLAVDFERLRFLLRIQIEMLGPFVGRFANQPLSGFRQG